MWWRIKFIIDQWKNIGQGRDTQRVHSGHDAELDHMGRGIGKGPGREGNKV